MTAEKAFTEGGCACGAVRYRMAGEPLIVHCCHCRQCQCETGSAFALNALIEADRVELLGGEVESADRPTSSGKGQRVTRCRQCHVALWSSYLAMGEAVRFVRVGTLDEPGRFPPDIHIHTSSKQPWVVLPPDARVVPEYYRASEQWSAESLARWAVLMPKR